MDRNELNKWRRNVPRALAGFAITPFVINLGVFASNEKLFLSVIIPAFGYFFWFAYDAVGFREALWREEMDRFVNKQIKERIESLFPPELNITREEMDAIREKEIKKRLSGIFWETVDSDSQLKETKAWFFENGICYSTAFDVFIIFGLSGYAYLLGLHFSPSGFYLITSTILILTSIISWEYIIPIYRKRHLKLSAEQMDMVAKRQGAAVRSAVTIIVTEMRNKK